ncbi:RNA polymerase sigma factor [Bacillus sp. 03113]|uniref:RNA polymerase sigma factor n=1 Tax=Bacillus sp. 03113 TaxID=2578211 RepID=UPI001141C4CE|nr:sigma-70 family RNA polymerase sigma factor [Bacillus sp. 03113]
MLEQELTHLIQEARGGNQEAFTALVSRYKGTIFRQAYAMINDRSEAEDIAQEAFVKAYLSLAKLENDFAFVSWLTRIVTNLCYDKLKKLNKANIIRIDIEEQDSLLSKAALIDQMDLRLEIKEAMQQLSADHRIVLVLRDVQGYSYDEIADILKIPIGTVKSRIHKARMILKNELTRGDGNE